MPLLEAGGYTRISVGDVKRVISGAEIRIMDEETCLESIFGGLATLKAEPKLARGFFGKWESFRWIYFWCGKCVILKTVSGIESGGEVNARIFFY